MKKLSKLLLCLTLILVSCFAMVGCGDTPPENEPDNPPVTMSFDDYFSFSALTTYTGGSDCISIDMLSQLATYKCVTLYAKKDVSFTHFGFKISSEENSSEEIYVTIKFGTAIKWNSISTYQINAEKTSIDCYYVKWNGSSSNCFEDNINHPNLTQEIYSIQKGTEIKIYFGTEDYNPAGGEYTTQIKLTDFIIE